MSNRRFKMGKSRLEAFSDGVLAIVITICAGACSEPAIYGDVLCHPVDEESPEIVPGCAAVTGKFLVWRGYVV